MAGLGGAIPLCHEKADRSPSTDRVLPPHLRSARLVVADASPWKWPGAVKEWLTGAVAPSAIAVAEPEADALAPEVSRSKNAWEPSAVVALLDALALAEAANAIGVEARMRPKTVEISSPNLL